jgi:hypothetical protein
MEITLCYFFSFSLAAFNTFPLCLIFVSLINVSGCISLSVYPSWDSLGFLYLGGYFLSHVREVFYYNLFKYFLRPFLFFWNPYKSTAVAVNVVTEDSETVLISFHSFFFILLCSSISTIPSFSSFIHSSAQLVCYWFLPVYFSFQLLRCSTMIILYPCSFRSLLSSWSISLFYFWDLGSSLL